MAHSLLYDPLCPGDRVDFRQANSSVRSERARSASGGRIGWEFRDPPSRMHCSGNRIRHDACHPHGFSLNRGTSRAARQDPRKNPRMARPSNRSANKAWDCDRELVDQILSGSREHFDLLYETYFPRVYRFALKRLGDPGEAEDVAQEVFLTLMTALASYKGESSLLVWIFGVTRNKVNRRFRRPRPRLEPLEEGGALDIQGFGPSTDEMVDAKRVLGRCEDVIAHDLTPLQRRIFHLKHLRQQPIRADRECARQERGCSQGESLSDAAGDFGWHSGTRGHPARLARSQREAARMSNPGARRLAGPRRVSGAGLEIFGPPAGRARCAAGRARRRAAQLR